MIRTTRAHVIWLVSLGLIAGWGAGTLMAHPLPTTIQLPPCVTEDSQNCYWQADQAGNKIGASFVDIDGITYSPLILP